MRQGQLHRMNVWVRLGIAMVMTAGFVLSTSLAAFADGEVTVDNPQVGNPNNVRITGDGGDNNIEIVSDGNAQTITVSSLDGATTINGDTTVKTFDVSGRAAVVVAMGPGMDVISFAADDELFWNVFMQNDDDTFLGSGFFALRFNVARTRGGGQIVGCAVDKLHLHMNRGDDVAAMICDVAGELNIQGDQGDDDLLIFDTSADDITIEGFEGINTELF